MSKQSYLIHPSALVEFKKLFDDETIEFCCLIDIDKSNNTLYFSPKCWKGQNVTYIKKDGKVGQRGACSYYLKDNIYPEFIFHTHPDNTYPYPSKEDIQKLFKHHEIKASIIYTKEGLWILRLPQVMKNAVKRDFWINNVFNIEKHYYMFGKYFDYFQNSLEKYYKTYDRLDANIVNQILEYFNQKMFLNIKFIPIKLIQDNPNHFFEFSIQ